MRFSSYGFERNVKGLYAALVYSLLAVTTLDNIQIIMLFQVKDNLFCCEDVFSRSFRLYKMRLSTDPTYVWTKFNDSYHTKETKIS